MLRQTEITKQNTLLYKTTKLLSAGALMLASTTALAVPIDSNVSIFTEVSFDNFNSTTALGNSTQGGNFGTVIGGASTSSSVADTTVTGNNPQDGFLTDLGDGLFSSFAISGTNDGSDAENYNFFADYYFELDNLSATDTYRLTFEVETTNSADGNGANAYASSLLSLFDDFGTEVFFTDITSDTVFEDEFNGTLLGTFGDPQSDAQTVQLFFDLAPATLFIFDGYVDMSGGAYVRDNSYGASLESSITLVDVENITTPSPVPAPGTLALLIAGFAGLGFSRRGNKNH